MEQQGVSYTLRNRDINEKHYDFTPLINAHEKYLDLHLNYHYRPNLSFEDLWSQVGKAQRDVPAHVAQEYCQEKRFFLNDFHISSLTKLSFDKKLQRNLKIKNILTILSGPGGQKIRINALN